MRPNELCRAYQVLPHISKRRQLRVHDLFRGKVLFRHWGPCVSNISRLLSHFLNKHGLKSAAKFQLALYWEPSRVIRFGRGQTCKVSKVFTYILFLAITPNSGESSYFLFSLFLTLMYEGPMCNIQKLLLVTQSPIVTRGGHGGFHSAKVIGPSRIAIWYTMYGTKMLTLPLNVHI